MKVQVLLVGIASVGLVVLRASRLPVTSRSSHLTTSDPPLGYANTSQRNDKDWGLEDAPVRKSVDEQPTTTYAGRCSFSTLRCLSTPSSSTIAKFRAESDNGPAVQDEQDGNTTPPVPPPSPALPANKLIGMCSRLL